MAQFFACVTAAALTAAAMNDKPLLAMLFAGLTAYWLIEAIREK